mmetsp:Transcript_29211/g.54198  ORF Transcript_29211/g.54198 Transcript_29211/m.54198 type:complete len:157 (+) Transcript_29211:72-542(+)
MNSEFSSVASYLAESPAPVNPGHSRLAVAPSLLGAAAGEGLFAAKFIPKGTVLCRYEGQLLSTRQAMRLQDKSYLMRLGSQCYVDAMKHMHVLARYINDCRNANCYNVTFLKSPTEHCAWVISLRDIQPDEEVYVDYGRWYWVGKKPKRLIKIPAC